MNSEQLTSKDKKKLLNDKCQLINARGFTLVEILVTMAIVAIVGTILVTIFTNTLRGSNKSQILAVIKQNGQAVLENMDKTIRGADNVVCISSDARTLVVVKSGEYTRYRITPQPSDNSINGYIQQDNPEKPLTGDDSDIKLFKDSVCINPLVNPNALTDTNLQTGVSVASGSFSRNPQSGYKDSVTVTFTLKAGVEAPAVIAGQIEPVEFKTTVGLR